MQEEQNPGSGQVKVGATIHLTFDELETVDMAFDNAVAEGAGKGSQNGWIIGNAFGEGLEGTQTRVGGLGKSIRLSK